MYNSIMQCGLWNLVMQIFKILVQLIIAVSIYKPENCEIWWEIRRPWVINSIQTPHAVFDLSFLFFFSRARLAKF